MGALMSYKPKKEDIEKLKAYIKAKTNTKKNVDGRDNSYLKNNK
jgi:hypothetical protein